MTNFFPIVDLKGRAYELGMQHGRSLAAKIKANLAFYFRIFRELTGLESRECIAYAGRFLDVMQADAPFLLEEMQGIAQGAGIDLRQVLFLNARSELMSLIRLPGATKNAVQAECTALGLTGHRTVSGKPVLAQNWDWYGRMRQTSAIFRIEPAYGPKAIFLAEAGQVGKIGVNENGVGVLLNILLTEKMTYGLPVHVLLRLIMDAKNTTEAVNLVKNARRAGASHFLIGDKGGDIRGLEIMPPAVKEISPSGGAVLHTNHFCDAEMAQKDVGRLIMTDTFARLDRATLLLSKRAKWDRLGLVEILANHDDAPGSICRHAQPDDPDHQKIDTVASGIINLDASKMLISYGQPCQAGYRELGMP